MVLHLLGSLPSGHVGTGFQSPSRRGWSCIARLPFQWFGILRVSVPFSKGMVLHRRQHAHYDATLGVSVPFSKGMVLHPDMYAEPPEPVAFQSPSRRGWSCIIGAGVGTVVSGVVSVPFSKGMVLHPMNPKPDTFPAGCFSPLLEGDGLASKADSSHRTPHLSFSPLLEGDGLASMPNWTAAR